jgi:hypothetical protein
VLIYNIISTDEDPGLPIESFAKIKICGVSTKYGINYIIFFTMQMHKELFISVVIKKPLPEPTNWDDSHK